MSEMKLLRPIAPFFLTLLAFTITTTTAQLLTNGNSQLPSCATTCPLLEQAAAACGGTTTADQAIWSCFCQSAYLTSLKTSDTGICDSVCTSASDGQQVVTWFNSNCGTDDGASEHADSGTTTVVAVISTSTSYSSTSTATATAAVAATSDAALPSTTASGSEVDPADQTSYTGNWWSSHWV